MSKILRAAAGTFVAVCCSVVLPTVAGAVEPPLGISWVETAPVVAVGDEGAAVAEWQRLLNDWIAVDEPENPFRLAVDGEFGPLTDGLTRSFQDAQGVPVDGIVGRLTRAAYLSAPELAVNAPRAAPAVAFLARGDTGADVAAWQVQLNRWLATQEGAPAPLAVDADFGARTDAITRAFQANQGIVVDGLVGTQTLAAMISAPAIANGVLVPSEGAVPAAGVCADAVGPRATIVVRADAPEPRCLRVRSDQQLVVVNEHATPVTVEIGPYRAEVAETASVQLGPRLGAFLAPGVHTLRVSSYGGAGPQLVLAA